MIRNSDLQTIRDLLYEGLTLSDDVEYRELQSGDSAGGQLLYIKSLCDNKGIVQGLIKPFWEMGSLERFEQYLLSLPGCELHQDVHMTIELLLQGCVGIFLPNNIYLLEAKNPQFSPVNATTVEAAVQGPQDGFTENIVVNLNLIRSRYQADSLRVEMNTMGEISKTKIALMYDKSRVNETALEEVKQQLSEVQVDLLQSTGDLSRRLSGSRLSLVPLIVVTERPDRSVLAISEGKIIILIDKTPFVAIVPSIFSDFLRSMDDKYQLPIVGGFLMVLRYIGFWFAITMPALYVATISYNPEVFRVQLAFSIASSRSAVPYPSYLEVIFMLLMMEFLTEASIRLPKSIGPAATTVGGLILGQAATEAGLVSNIMIIIVSVVALSNFVVPINEMSFAIRIIKYMLLIIAVFFGLIGMVVGLLALAFYLVNLNNYGTPYIQLFRKDRQPNGN